MKPAWRDFFADPAALSQLRAAATECTKDGCACGADADDPAFCDCPSNRMMPIELVDWIEREVFIAEKGAGVRRMDHREHIRDAAKERDRNRGKQGRFLATAV